MSPSPPVDKILEATMSVWCLQDKMGDHKNCSSSTVTAIKHNERHK